LVSSAFLEFLVPGGFKVPGAKFNYEDADEGIVARVKNIEAVCATHGVSLASAALQFPLGHEAVSTVIAGVKSPVEVQRAVDTMNMSIPSALWADLKAGGLIPADVPTPGPGDV
jgi:D-threo-aldose 1-dehydrogenase